MKVALACPYAWDDPGGVQVHVRELAQHLLGVGHDVLVLAPARRRPSETWVRAVGRPVDITYNASNAPIDPRPWSVRAVRDVLRGFSPDVVHVHEPFSPSTSLWATLSASAPVVATFHSGADRARLYDLASPVLRRIGRRIVVRIAVSRAAERFVASHVGGSYEIVPNGVDVARFEHAESANLGPGVKLLFVGRLDERKGFPTAVDAFAELARTRTDVHLIVAGDGPERSAVDRLPTEVRRRVRMLGVVPSVDLPPIHAACHLYLATSVGGESFGIVLVEAMAAGLPVVASRIPGYDEVARDGVDSLLVPPRDPGSAAAAAARLLDDPELAAAFAAAGRERARTFDWHVVAARIESLYGRAVARGPLR